MAAPPVENKTAANTSNSRGGTLEFRNAGQKALYFRHPHTVHLFHLPADLPAEPVGRFVIIMIYSNFEVKIRPGHHRP